MSREIKMSHLRDALDELEYPIHRDEAASRFDGVILLLADGEVDLGGRIADVPGETYDRRGDLEADLHTTLPRRAVGEPYQSEGDA